MRKSLVIASTALPPSASGQAKVLERLLGGRDDLRYWFLSDNASTFTQDPGLGLGHYLRTGAPQPGLARRLLGGGEAPSQSELMKTVAYRAEEIESLLRGVPVAAVIGCSGNPFDLGGAAIAAERMGAPFIAYLFDDPVYQWPEGPYRRLARTLEPRWSKRAAVTICPNEILAADFRARTGRDVQIVRNPVKDDALFAAPAGRASAKHEGEPVRIVYTGSVYHAQGDAFANLVAAMAMTPGRYKLDVYTSQPASALVENGLTGDDVVHHPHLDDVAVARLQQEADILFLPLAFRSSIHEVLLSSSPGKTAEYLMSGRPVLVHAPAGSFVSTFFRRTQAGLVVDEPSTQKLAEALERLRTDETLALSLTRAAAEAGRGFSLAAARTSFWGAIARAAGVPA